MDAHLLPCRGRFDLATLRGMKDQLRAAPDAVLHVHDYKSAFYAWLAARRTRTPLVATVHGWVETSGALRLYKRLELTLLRRFDRVVVVADALRSVLERAGIKPTRVCAIANGVDTDRFMPRTTPLARSEFDLPASSFLFGSVARLAPEKNLAALVDAIGVLVGEGLDAALLLVGDGPQRAALEAQAKAAGMGERVRFTGARTDTDRIYPMLDCFVLPSLTEGMPLAVLEAMACARPVVASAIGEIPHLLAGSDMGKLVPQGDNPALVAAMREALKHRGIDHAARRHVKAHYSVTAWRCNTPSFTGICRRQAMAVPLHDRRPVAEQRERRGAAPAARRPVGIHGRTTTVSPTASIEAVSSVSGRHNWPLYAFLFFLPLQNLQTGYMPNLGGGFNFLNIGFALSLIGAWYCGGRLTHWSTVHRWVLLYVIWSFVTLWIGYANVPEDSANRFNVLKDSMLGVMIIFLVQMSVTDWSTLKRVVLMMILPLPYILRVTWYEHESVSSWHYNDALRISGTFSWLGANEYASFCVTMALDAVRPAVCGQTVQNLACIAAGRDHLHGSWGALGLLAYRLRHHSGRRDIDPAAVAGRWKMIVPLVLAAIIVPPLLPQAVTERLTAPTRRSTSR